MVINDVLEHRGIKDTWLATQLGISRSHLSRLLSGERSWTADLRAKAAQILMLPESVLFLPCNAQETEQNESTNRATVSHDAL